MNAATTAANEINAKYFETISAFADDETLVVRVHEANRARLETGSITLNGSAIAAWPTIVDSLK